jgi:NAD(P)-dependent dehydrogenase (short-subunit alcohol dehydrogenase family)
MQAIVIGGTTGFGEELSKNLLNTGYKVLSIGRSKPTLDGVDSYICDVGDLKKWKELLETIKAEYPSIDLVIFAVGYARAKSSRDLTIEDWQEHINKNFLYVTLGLENLKDCISAKANSKVVTIGSQWSYKIGNDELVPYTTTKHALDALTKDFAARNPSIKANHYCVPTMNTKQYAEVAKSFDAIGKEFATQELADRGSIAKNLIDHVLTYNRTGKTLVVGVADVKEI